MKIIYTKGINIDWRFNVIENTESYIWFQKLMVELSTANNSKNDFYLILAIIDSMAEKSGLSIEEMSEKSGVSTATISRFINKLGFTNYRDFRSKIQNIIEISSVVRYYKYNKTEQNDPQKILDNIKGTSENMDLIKLREIIEIIKKSEKRLFVGFPETLANFTGFRKDLFVTKHPCYLFFDVTTQIDLLNSIDSKSCVIVLSVYNESMLFYKNALEKAKKNGVNLILFTQDFEDEFSKTFSIVYRYGIDNALNFGNYSLSYLSGVLSSLLY